MYRARRSNADPLDLSTNQSDYLTDNSRQEQTTIGQAHPEPDAAQGPSQWDGTGPA